MRIRIRENIGFDVNIEIHVNLRIHVNTRHGLGDLHFGRGGDRRAVNGLTGGTDPFEEALAVAGGRGFAPFAPAPQEVVRKGISAIRLRVPLEIGRNREPGGGIAPFPPAGLDIVQEWIRAHPGDVIVDRAVEDRVKGRRQGAALAFRDVALAHAEIPVRWRACVQQKTATIN